MADTSVPAAAGPPAAGGGGFSRRVAGVPVWAWSVAGGLGLGVAYLIWRSRKTNQADDQAAADQQTSSTDQPVTAVPIDQGLSQTQFEQLQQQIKDLQGPPSAPPTTPAPPKPAPKGSKPGPFVLTSAHAASGHRFTVHWTKSAGATTYEVEMSGHPHAHTTKLEYSGTFPAGTYSVRIRASNKAGSTLSNPLPLRIK